MIRFTADLDPGLGLIAVSGPEVMEFRAEREGPVTRVRVALSGTRDCPRRFISRRARCLDGLWSVPAMRPVDAIWTGGTTTVVLDRLRVMQDCRDRTGRASRTGRRAGGSDALVFEASSADSGRGARVPSAAGSPVVSGTRPAPGRPGRPVLECELIGLGGQWPHKGAEHRAATDLGCRSRALEQRTNRLPGIRPFRRTAAPGCTCFPTARGPRKAEPWRSQHPPRPREERGPLVLPKKSVPPV